MSSTGSITHWLEQLRAGNRDAVKPLLERYFPRLVGLARKKRQGARLAAADAEDVAQSAFHSFCQGVARGRLEGEGCRPTQPDQSDLRGWEWYYLRGLRHKDVLTVPGDEGVARGAAQHGVAFSPDGRSFAASGWREVRVWDTESGRLIRTLTGHTDQVRGVAYSPDGRWLASRGYDGTVKTWDTARGQEIRTLRHGAWVCGLAISSGGRMLASSVTDGKVRSLKEHSDYVFGLAYSPAGRLAWEPR
jgi:hypothetical protein